MDLEEDDDADDALALSHPLILQFPMRMYVCFKSEAIGLYGFRKRWIENRDSHYAFNESPLSLSFLSLFTFFLLPLLLLRLFDLLRNFAPYFQFPLLPLSFIFWSFRRKPRDGLLLLFMDKGPSSFIPLFLLDRAIKFTVQLSSFTRLISERASHCRAELQIYRVQ